MDVEQILRDFGPPVGTIIGIIVAVKVIIRLVPRMTKSAPEKFRRQIEYMLPKLIWIFGLLIMFGSLGIDITSLLALMATAGIGLALVFTPVGQNLFAGFLAGIDDVVREGDVINVLGTNGRIVRKGSLSVGVEMPDGSMIYLPNVKAVDDEFTNHSRIDGARIAVEIKLDHSPDRAAAVACMQQTLDGLEWRRQDKPTTVLFTEIGANALHYTCYAWIEDRLDEPKYKSAMLTALVNDLEHAGFSYGETSYIATERFTIQRTDSTSHGNGNGNGASSLAEHPHHTN